MSKAEDNSLEQLEALSNSELRVKCIEHGLPNVPVTDSSRNVLIRKLRVSIGGGGAGGPSKAAAIAPKKTNRRETIHVVNAKQPLAAAADIEGEKVASNRPPSRPANRRTIAATMSFTKEQPPVVPEVAAPPQPIVSGIPAPIGNRRRSTVREQLASGYVPPLPIVSTVAAAAAIRSNSPLIILESDDEDEVDMILAAEQLELAAQVQERRNKPASRAASLSKAGVQTTSYQQPSPPLQEEVEFEVERPLATAGDNFRSSTMIHNAARKLIAAPPEPLATRIMPPSTQRYANTKDTAAASYYAPMLRRSAAPSGYTMTTSSQPRVSDSVGSTIISGAYYNEQSDDTDTGGVGDEPIRTPYLSNFARNLERIKAEPLGGDLAGIRSGALFGSETDIVQRRFKQRSSKVYEGGARQPINPQQEEESLAESLGQLFAALERRYHLKRNAAVFLLILLIVFLFVIFWQ